MKIFWASNAPWAGSGYGQTTARFTPRLRDMGHDVAMFANYGLKGDRFQWNDMTVYPSAYDGWGNDVLTAYALHWFGGDRNAGWVMLLQDVWTMKSDTIRSLHVCGYAPCDHSPAPPGVIEFFTRTGAVPMAMSKHGFRMFEQAGLKPLYTPHGIDTKLFRPVPETREIVRDALGIPTDAFVYAMVAANQASGELSRKAFPETFQAFKAVHERHPDTFLYLHTVRNKMYSGLDLDYLAEQVGLEKGSYGFVDQFGYILGEIHTEDMPGVYSAVDCLVNPALGEGFGMPIIEAQACFPADTPVHASGVVRSMERAYTGTMYRVSTPRGGIEATAEHPFWTDRGWVPARELRVGDCLYHWGHGEEGRPQVRGAIGRAHEALRGDAAARSGGEAGAVLRIGLSPGGRVEAAETDGSAARSQASGTQRPGACLCGGHGGCRRHSDDPQDGGREVEAAGEHRKYVLGADGMVREGASAARTLYRLSEDVGWNARIPVLHSGSCVPAVLPSARPAARDQTTALGTGGRMDGGTLVAVEDRPSFSATSGDSRADSGAEYTPITAIETREVTAFPVFNFTTLSATYVAGGFLVHNCGVPVVLADNTAMTDLCGGGWLVPCNKVWDETQRSWWGLVTVKDLTVAMEKAFQSGAKPGKQAREFVVGEYDVDDVMTQHWKPALETLEGMLHAPEAAPIDLSKLKL